MSGERFISQAVALLLSLLSKCVFSRKILIMRVLEMRLSTFYTTHTYIFSEFQQQIYSPL